MTECNENTPDPPFLGEEEIEALKFDAQTISPQEQARLATIETQMSEKFWARYGHMFDDVNKQNYMKRATIVTVDRDTFTEFDAIMQDIAHSEADIKQPPEEYRLLNGLLYESYGVNPDESQQSANPDTINSDTGGISYPQEPGLVLSVDEHDEHLFAITCIHEKNHAIQDSWLPLPLLEAHSYWITNDVIGYQGQIPKVHQKLIDAFQTLYEEFGDDLHRLIWGELSKERRLPLYTRLREKLNLEFVDSMLPDGYSWRAKRFQTREQMLEELASGDTSYSKLQHHVIETRTSTRELTK